MDVRRTAVVKLTVSDEQRDALHRTAEQYLYCTARTEPLITVGPTPLTPSVRPTSERCVTRSTPNFERRQTYRPSLFKPPSNALLKLSKRVSNDGKMDSASLNRRSPPKRWTTTRAARPSTGTRCRWQLLRDESNRRSFVLPADSPTPYERYVLSENYEFRESTLRYDAATDEFYLNISMRRTDGDDEVSEDTGHPDQTVLGIDLGVNSLAVSSTGTFWQGDDYDHWCREFEKRRGEMQHCGTQAAHKALLRLGKREEAWRKQYIHTIANELVSEAIEHDCDVIAFEDLNDIREGLPQAKWHHVWAFRRLFEYVSYKAPEQGVSVEQVEPNHTSQRCSRTDCGFTHPNNRQGEHFECQKCGYEVNADYNAAKNIGLRYARKRTHRLRSSPKSGNGDAQVDVRINGGTLNGGSHQPIAGD